MANPSTPKLAVIILNWNGIKDTLSCIKSLQKQSINLTIIVIDNGSKDNSIDILKRTPNIILLEEAKNIGFAGGVNVGIKYAIEKKYTYVALFNNDAVADKNWANELTKTVESSNYIGIVTGLLLNFSGKKIDSTGEQYSNWGLPFPRNRGDNANKAPEKQLVFGATGGASLYKVDMFKKIGLFDEDFFAYYEDVDISFRAQLAGYKIAYNPKAIAYHKQGEASKKTPGFTVYQAFKNLPLLFIKNVPTRLIAPIGIKFYFAYWLMFFNAVFKGNGKYAFKGLVISFLLGFKKLSERYKIQNSKSVDSSYIKEILWKDLPPNQIGIKKLRKAFTGKD